MNERVSHDRSEETLEAKARWFQTLSIEERMAFLCEVTEMALAQNPDLARKSDVPATDGPVLVLELSDVCSDEEE